MNSERLAYALSNKRKVPIGYVKETEAWPKRLRDDPARDEALQYSNCFGFALWLVGFPEFQPFWTDGGHVLDVLEAAVKIPEPEEGCLVLLWQNVTGDLEHAAVYIGKGWYIHQVGQRGPVGRHRLKHVLELYPDCDLQFVVPPAKF